MINTININTPGGDINISKCWVKKQLLDEKVILQRIGDTFFMYSESQTWSITKKDYDMIMIEIRDDKINNILSDSCD